MSIGLLFIILAATLFLCGLFYENFPTVSKISILLILICVIWLSLAYTRYEQKKRYIKTTPVLFQDDVAFSIHENNLINCSKDFKKQFKPGDSIFIFQEVDTWVMGLKWSGGEFLYKTEKYTK